MADYLKEAFEKYGNKVNFSMPDVEIEKPLSYEMENKLSCFPKAVDELDKIQTDGLIDRQSKLSAAPPSSKIKDFWYSNKIINWFLGRSLAMKPADRVMVVYDKLRQAGVSDKDASYIAPRTTSDFSSSKLP